MSKTSERAAQAKVDKFDARRRELAEAALVAIAARGYANTGLRDVAAETELSTGILHYYFNDKNDLVAQAIWQYKTECAKRYDPIVETAVTADELLDRFGQAIAATLRDETDMHRLWYDLRNQSLFDAGFRDTIVAIDELLEAMVWRVVTAYAELAGGTPHVDAKTAYSLFDGLFMNSMIGFVRGELDAIERLRVGGVALLTASVTPDA